ncbi:MAG: STAS/SEC14 domain-containing protein [Chloroflexota bacterium]|nr:STAS/SEC14 domain-containing protein [Chloroflexota bacterium]
MAIQYHVMDDMPVIRIDVQGKISLKESQEIEALLIPILDRAERPLYLLIDMSRMEVPSPDILRASNSTGFIHPNVKKMALFGSSAVVRSIINFIVRLAASDRVQFFATEQEAMDYLNQAIAEEHAQ